MERERWEGRKQEVRTELSYVGWSKAQFPWLEHPSKWKEDRKTANGGFLRNGRKKIITRSFYFTGRITLVWDMVTIQWRQSLQNFRKGLWTKLTLELGPVSDKGPHKQPGGRRPQALTHCYWRKQQRGFWFWWANTFPHHKCGPFVFPSPWGDNVSHLPRS